MEEMWRKCGGRQGGKSVIRNENHIPRQTPTEACVMGRCERNSQREFRVTSFEVWDGR